MTTGRTTPGRREQAKRDKQQRILAAARELLAEHGVGAVTTQQVADRADVAIGTLYLYATTKAELLIMVQNHKFAAAIHDGVAASTAAAGAGVHAGVMALIGPVVACVREHPENGRTYLHERVLGDPAEPYRREGLLLSAQLDDAVSRVVLRESDVDPATASTLARVVSAVVHLATTASVYLERTDAEVLADIGTQVAVVLTGCRRPT